MSVLDYRDPLFGIVVLLLLCAVVSLGSFLWNRHKEKKQSDSLREFMNRFDYVGFDSEVKRFLALSDDPIPSLLFVAKIYEKSGEYEKAINLYITLLDTVSTPLQKIPILELLGTLYRKAGFLARAKDIFMQILAHHPRDIKALKSLIDICESLADYKGALDALDCLEELGEKTETTFYYFKAKLLLQEMQVSSIPQIPQKIKSMQKLLLKEPKLIRIAMRFYLQYAPNLFWEYFKPTASGNPLDFLDILWNIPQNLLDYETISSNATLQQIFTLKTTQNTNQEVKKNATIKWNFELEVLHLLQNNPKNMQNLPQYPADLDFEYRCKSCHFTSPLEFGRCSQCGESLEVQCVAKLRIIQTNGLENEEYFSFL